MIAVIPAFAASSNVSGIGKKASDASALPCAFSPACVIAIFAEPTRFICPAPTPIVMSSFAKTIAFDFTCFTTFQASFKSFHSCSEGSRFVGIEIVLSSNDNVSSS